MATDMYYGHYKSSTTSQTGCIQEFVTVPQSTMMFPPQVIYECILCKSSHGFRFTLGHIASTRKQKGEFEAYCTKQGIELGVKVD